MSCLKKSSSVSSSIFVLGNQKSGTTVISELLSQSSELQIQRDFSMRTLALDDLRGVAISSHDIEYFCSKYSYLFRKSIVKEPNLSLIACELADLYPDSRFVYIVREPKSNIRSILSRLKLTQYSTVKEVSSSTEINRVWKWILSGEDLVSRGGFIPTDSVIYNLAHRWRVIDDIVLSASKSTVLVRYEDFLDDRVASIRSLTKSLDLIGCDDFIKNVNTQYQTAAKTKSNSDFYSAESIELIENITAKGRSRHGYS